MKFPRRYLRVGASLKFETPILYPSFSSKGFLSVDNIFKSAQQFITDEVLVSAYDLYYGNIKDPEFGFSTLVCVDSGGYEVSKDSELSEVYSQHEYSPPEWRQEFYEEVISEWDSDTPTIFVSFDHPKHRCDLESQIERAKALQLPNENSGRILLIKPERIDNKLVPVGKIESCAHLFGEFSAIGVTEKEIGSNFKDRMKNIRRIRNELDKHFEGMPIHVFGSLDTFSCYLYFVAGADIFDGLTWLRYAFYNGSTLYRQQFGALNMPSSKSAKHIEQYCAYHNYSEMAYMKEAMERFRTDGNYAHFKPHQETIKRLHQDLVAKDGGE